MTLRDARALRCPHGSGRLLVEPSLRTRIGQSTFLTLEGLSRAAVIGCSAQKPCTQVFPKPATRSRFRVQSGGRSFELVGDDCSLVFDSGLSKEWDANAGGSPALDLCQAAPTAARLPAATESTPGGIEKADIDGKGQVSLRYLYADGSPARGAILALRSIGGDDPGSLLGTVKVDERGCGDLSGLDSGAGEYALVSVESDPNEYFPFEDWQPSILARPAEAPRVLLAANLPPSELGRMIASTTAEPQSGDLVPSFSPMFDLLSKIAKGDFLPQEEQTLVTISANVFLGLVPGAGSSPRRS